MSPAVVALATTCHSLCKGSNSEVRNTTREAYEKGCKPFCFVPLGLSEEVPNHVTECVDEEKEMLMKEEDLSDIDTNVRIYEIRAKCCARNLDFDLCANFQSMVQ
jgi:hypothetical protein